MIPTGFTDKDMHLFLQRLASHSKLSDKWLKSEVKPARKGEIFGKGGKGKVPKNKWRGKITLTDYAKSVLEKYMNINE